MSRNCPNCGTAVPAGQRFCSNCGTPMEPAGPPSQYGGPPPQSFPQAQPQPQPPSFTPSQPPPYAQAQFGQPQPYQQYQQNQQPQKSSPIAEALGALGLLFLLRRYRPGYRARRQSSGCCGCLVTLVILLIILGIPAYAIYRANPHIFQQIQQNVSKVTNSNNTNNTNNANNGSVPTTQPHITTAPINQTVTYAGVDITIVSVEQATAFLDDNSTSANGMIRVNIKEVNNTNSSGNYFYSDITRLILPDQSSVAPVNELQSVAPDKSTSRDNWLDFPVPTSDKINQLTLVFGTSQDAQISVPLTGNANLSAFQTKTVNVNIPISYGGLNWTLKSATSSLSIGGKQASTGMRYVVLVFNVDNPTANGRTIGFPEEYMRLQSGDITNTDLQTTLPLGINANTTGSSGSVTYLMPANDTDFTLIFLAGQHIGESQPSPQVNTPFKI